MKTLVSKTSLINHLRSCLKLMLNANTLQFAHILLLIFYIYDRSRCEAEDYFEDYTRNASPHVSIIHHLMQLLEVIIQSMFFLQSFGFCIM